MSSLYETDFYAWTQEQTKLLRHQQWNKLDVPNLIEEIESWGKQQRQELRNRLSILIGLLLKWEYQPAQQSHSWLSVIKIQRIDIQDLLLENPSLKPFLEEAIGKVYRKSIEIAVSETNLPHKAFPSECPYGFEQILDDGFYPGKTSAELEK